MPHHHLETAFSIDTSAIKFGPGVTHEVGYEPPVLGQHYFNDTASFNFDARKPNYIFIEPSVGIRMSKP